MTRILADVGGTRARFAWQAAPGAALDCIDSVDCCDFAGLTEALRDWLDRHRPGAPVEAALALATPITDADEVRMTNSVWCFSRHALAACLGLERVELVNDFAALALALPALKPDELRQIGGPPAKPFARRETVALLGPGTGLGVSGLLPGPGGCWVPIAGEGGHVSLSCSDSREDELLQILRARFGHVSAERVLSGEGLRNLWAALRSMDTQAQDPAPSAARISEGALNGQDPFARRVIETFCALLGHVAGNLALTLGARGGVYLGGGIVPQWGTLVEHSRLCETFVAKGRFRSYLQEIPIWVIDAREPPALRGLARLLDARPSRARPRKKGSARPPGSTTHA